MDTDSNYIAISGDQQEDFRFAQSYEQNSRQKRKSGLHGTSKADKWSRPGLFKHT